MPWIFIKAGGNIERKRFSDKLRGDIFIQIDFMGMKMSDEIIIKGCLHVLDSEASMPIISRRT